MLYRTLIGRLPFLALLILVSACSVRPQPNVPRPETLLSEQPAPAGRQCTILDTPAELPAVATVVDSAALHDDILQLWHEKEIRSGYALMSLGFDRFGTNIRRDVIEHDIPVAVADSLQKLVFAHRQTVPEGEGDWGVRVRVDLVEDELQFRVGRQEVCAPRPRDSYLALAMDQMRFAGSPQTRVRNGVWESTVWVRLLVSPQGNVTNAVVTRGIIGGATETRLFDLVRGLFFDPALADGQPTSGWVTIPVRIQGR